MQIIHVVCQPKLMQRKQLSENSSAHVNSRCPGKHCIWFLYGPKNGPVHQKSLRSVAHWLAGSIVGSNLSRDSDVYLSENPNHLRLAHICFPALGASYTYQLRVLIGSLDYLRPLWLGSVISLYFVFQFLDLSKHQLRVFSQLNLLL